MHLTYSLSLSLSFSLYLSFFLYLSLSLSFFLSFSLSLSLCTELRERIASQFSFISAIFFPSAISFLEEKKMANGGSRSRDRSRSSGNILGVTQAQSHMSD